jgi:hypothetical protein
VSPKPPSWPPGHKVGRIYHDDQDRSCAVCQCGLVLREVSDEAVVLSIIEHLMVVFR